MSPTATRRLLAAAPLFLALCGCQFMPHALQPSQLWKLNRQPAMDEGQFSIPSGPANPLPPVASQSDCGCGK